MRITKDVMPSLHRSLLNEVQPGFNLRFSGSKDYIHFTTDSASLGLFSLSSPFCRIRKYFKARGNHRDFLGNTSVYQ